MTPERVDQTLRSLGELPPPPPLGDQLERELAGLAPVATRRPRRQLVTAAAVSLAIAGGLLALITLRRDLALLPRAWLIVYCAGWLVGFAGLAFLAIMPGRGQVSPGWRRAGAAAIAAGLVFVAAGLLLSRRVPGVSAEVGDSWADLWTYGRGCLGAGLATAIAPLLLGLLFLRGAVPVGAAWVGAAMGAAGGALGGLVLHLHCPIAHPMHLGLVHGGVVVVGALLGALAAPRFLRP